jgi:hypothetical protein
MIETNPNIFDQMLSRDTTLGELVDAARRFNASYIKAVVSSTDNCIDGAVIVLRGSDVESYLAVLEAEELRLDTELEGSDDSQFSLNNDEVIAILS